MTSSLNLFDVVLFLLSRLVTGPSFMSISPLVLELWQLSFIRDWPEIRKSEIPPSEFCPISGEWGELEIPNLALTKSLTKCYWILQNGKDTAFTVFLFFLFLFYFYFFLVWAWKPALRRKCRGYLFSIDMNNTNKMLSTILYTISYFINQSIIDSSSSSILDGKGKFEWSKRAFVIRTSRSDLVYGGKAKHPGSWEG